MAVRIRAESIVGGLTAQLETPFVADCKSPVLIPTAVQTSTQISEVCFSG